MLRKSILFLVAAMLLVVGCAKPETPAAETTGVEPVKQITLPTGTVVATVVVKGPHCTIYHTKTGGHKHDVYWAESIDGAFCSVTVH